MNNEAAVLKVLFQKRFTFYKELAILKINRCNYFLNRCRHKKSNKHLRRRAAEYLMGILSDRPKGRGIIPIIPIRFATGINST